MPTTCALCAQPTVSAAVIARPAGTLTICLPCYYGYTKPVAR